MTTFRTRQTLEGDRWDIISSQEYSDPYGYERILEANPEYRSLLSLPGGVMLRIPVIEDATPTIPQESLPPWKRA